MVTELTRPAERVRQSPPKRARRRAGTAPLRERLLATAMSLPVLLPFIVFSLVPIVYVVFLSFTSFNGFRPPEWIGLENYEDLMGDASWWQSVINTLVLAVGIIAIQIPLALLLAVVVSGRIRGAGAFRTVYFIPEVISLAVVGVIFYFLFRPNNGVINELLQGIGILQSDVDWLGNGTTAMIALIMVGVWSGFGINTVFFIVGLQTIPGELYESAEMDGAGPWQRFRLITLPMLAPIMRVVMMLSIVFTMRSFDLVKTLTNGGPAGQTEVMFTYLFEYYFGTTRAPQYGYGSALAVVSSIIIAIISVAYLWLSRNRDANPKAGR
ncbi:sugar ABC transporter permease [Microbacterium awajiense]|uniref:Sugar ABC transporter permease n=1 Tax=Microbacterium awajiense TaxID=415214 RepID=A0ABP7APU7_9MICO